MVFPLLVALTTPIIWLIVGLAGYALVAIPLVLWGLGRTNKRSLGWVVVPIVSFVASTVLWLYVNRQGFG